MALAVAMNATIILEQPANSLLEYYPLFRDFLQQLMAIGGPSTAPRLMQNESLYHNMFFCHATLNLQEALWHGNLMCACFKIEIHMVPF